MTMQRCPARTAERGAATVHAASIVVVLLAVSLIGLQVGSISRLQHAVTSTADLAALAASRAAADGADGCSAAARVAERNHARLTSCELAQAAATVEVTASSARMWGRTWTVRRHARAAPADYSLPP